MLWFGLVSGYTGSTGAATGMTTSGIETNCDTPWWALYTRHQHEKVVAEMLGAKGLEVFLPLYESIRRWKDRNKALWLPLFPCYVFVRGTLERRLQVVSTPGVHMILTNGERIATVPEEEIDAIRRTVEGSLRVEPHPFLKVGERVRVMRGTLEGVEGILVRKKNLYRLVLSVNMLAQSVAVEIDAADVEPVAPRGLTGAPPPAGYPSAKLRKMQPLGGSAADRHTRGIDSVWAR
jgi:transcription antitermination factor NusG